MHDMCKYESVVGVVLHMFWHSYVSLSSFKRYLANAQCCSSLINLLKHFLHFVILKHSLQFLQILNVLLVIQCGVVLDCFIIERYEVLYSLRVDYNVRGVDARNLIAGGNTLILINSNLYCFLVLLYLQEYLFHLFLLEHALRRHILFLKFLLLIVLFVYHESLLLEMPQNEIDAIICIIWQ